MEGTTTVSASGQALDAATLTEAVRRTSANHPDTVAIRTVDDGISLTWAELLHQVDSLAAGLAGLGIGHGNTVALMLTNRPEFQIADLAAAMLGATPFSIYTTYPAEEVAYVCSDAGAKLVITEQALLPVVLAARPQMQSVEQVIVVDGDAPAGTLALGAVEAAAPDFDVEAAAAAVTPDDLVTLIYTSGTTGPPKGVQLSHRNVMGAVRCSQRIVPLDPGSRVISWLPAAHIAERMAHHYMPTVLALTVTVCPDPRQIVSYLPQVHPNWFFAVPRIWEKLKAGLEAMQASQPDEVRAPVQQALEASLKRVRLRQRGEPVPEELESAWQRADAQLFSNLRVMLGLDQLVTVNVGAAPTAVEVLEFFHALGIEIAELWGMSETSGAGTCNPPGAIRIGTVGRASPGAEVKLADDGELLVRGEFVMVGYRGAPERTAEALDRDGWLHTGDIAEIDPDGYVRIVDRKKELIINAAGKNMSPANIEAALKSSSPLIGQVCVIGDRRPYNTAVIVLDGDFTPAWAAQAGIDTEGDLATNPAVIAAVQAGVDQANTHLSRVEQIKRFALVSDEWLPGGEELTPTMKLKRNPIAAKYEAEIEAMYR